MRIAIIGTGIAGNVIARHLHRDHELIIYEANSHIGGHTHTHAVELAGRRYDIDTGFIVFNDWTYPQFIDLLDELHVKTQATEMSFSSHCERSGLEYSGNSLNTLFAQRCNLINPRFYIMLRDILRFNRDAPKLLREDESNLMLGEYLIGQGYGEYFIEHYILPMGAAIWSSDPREMLKFPAVTFIQFFVNHGLLSVNDRPQWRVIKGGSRRYVDALTRPFADQIRLNTPVVDIKRHKDYVTIRSEDGVEETVDYVFIASHSDQALRLLSDPTKQEETILGNIHYQENSVVLHTDTRQLPDRRRAWAAWNYRRLHPDNHAETGRVSVTYNMNILQGIRDDHTFCVTLNNGEAIAPEKIIKRLTYTHPLFTPKAIEAQSQQAELNQHTRTFYCGAYWRYGFHEDGVISARNALHHFYEEVRYA